MKKLILLLLLPLFSYSQELNTAINFHNLIRSYYDLKPLKLNDSLSYVAEVRAEAIADANKIFFTDQKYGESVFFTNYFSLGRDYYLEASIGWLIDDNENTTKEQFLCKKCDEIGFGISISNDKVYVVAIYDKLYK